MILLLSILWIFSLFPWTESPKITDRCTKCKNKVDYGDEYICCTDCSDPYITDRNTKLGYCKTGAELAVQLKPKGT